MKTKLLSVTFVMLTVCTAWSQDTIADPPPWNLEFEDWNFSADTTDTRPISFPFWMVREIALDLEEKSQLEAEVRLLDLELQAHQLLVAGLQENNQRKDLQLELSRKQRALLELQLNSEKATNPKNQFLKQGLTLLGALGAGFVLGRL